MNETTHARETMEPRLIAETGTAARVAAIAGPDEVMVSSTVKDLVAGSGLQFVDRGAYNLKGVPGEWRLFAVQ